MDRPTRRYDELDGIRGLAALVVVLTHCLMAMPAAWPDSTAPDRAGSFIGVDGPLVLLGIASVRVFFVLSGFVLTLPILAQRNGPYTIFLIRRIARIYVPFAAAVALSAVACSLLPWPAVPAMSDWFNRIASAPITPELLAGHLLMSADPAFQTLDPPIWSLVHEMRISLIFPVLAFLVLKRPALAAAAASALFVLGYLPALSSTLSPYPLIFNLARTAPFLIYFVAGILAAIHLDRIATWLDRVGPRGRVALWLFAAALLTFPGGPRIQPVNFLAYGLGGTLLVCLVINSARARAVLGRPVLRWLGRISYSLYLVHCIVLVVLVRVLIGIVPPWLAVAAVPAVSLAAATLMCSWIEAPSQHAGRFISAVWSQRRARRRGQPTTAV